jgi:NTE family protein
MFFFSRFFKKKPRKVKLGLALGSGGAKGFAELGVLRAFEENGIEFDIVSGTSIGSIIGAFYANGYTSTDIGELLKRVDIGDIKNVFMLKMDMDGLFNVIDKAIGSINIEELKKPFSTVATASSEDVHSTATVFTVTLASI